MLLPIILSALFSNVASNPFDYDHCPPFQEELYPCVCARSTLYCYKKGITKEEFLNAIKFASFPELKIKVRGINFGNLSYEDINMITAEGIELKSCQLKNLAFREDPRFSSLTLSYTLKNLSFVNSIDDTNGDVELYLDPLEKLEELDFADNVIKHLRKDWFPNGLKSLTRLILHKNGIETIEENAFANLTKLRMLALDGNNLKTIKENYLPSSSYHLEVLNLNFNHIEYFSKDTFSDLASLSMLYLSHNNIKNLPEDTWGEIWRQLKILTLDGNPLVCDSQVKWTFDIRRPKYLSGKCAEPEDKANKNLAFLIDKRGRVSS